MRTNTRACTVVPKQEHNYKTKQECPSASLPPPPPRYPEALVFAPGPQYTRTPRPLLPSPGLPPATAGPTALSPARPRVLPRATTSAPHGAPADRRKHQRTREEQLRVRAKKGDPSPANPSPADTTRARVLGRTSKHGGVARGVDAPPLEASLPVRAREVVLGRRPALLEGDILECPAPRAHDLLFVGTFRFCRGGVAVENHGRVRFKILVEKGTDAEAKGNRGHQ